MAVAVVELAVLNGEAAQRVVVPSVKETVPVGDWLPAENVMVPVNWTGRLTVEEGGVALTVSCVVAVPTICCSVELVLDE